MVAPVGIEPTTHRASICCSTDWATGPKYGGPDGDRTRDLLRDREAY